MPTHQTLLCRYHYDPLDRLSGHVTAGDADTRLFYQKSHLATQIQGVLRRSVLQVDDQVLAQQHSSGKAVETNLLTTDQQRSVLQLIGSGHREALAYTAYGHLPMSSGLSSLLGFDGERRDPVTGHYLLGNGYRALNPVLMRFNRPDSLSPFGEGGLNAYAYCQGDPVNYRDPTGHIKASLFLSWNPRNYILRPLPGVYRSRTALQLPRVMISPPSAVSTLVSKSSAVLTKANVSVKDRSLLKRTAKFSSAQKKRLARPVAIEPQGYPLPKKSVMDSSRAFSYRQEDYRGEDLNFGVGIQQPGAPFLKIQKFSVLSRAEAMVAVQAVRL